MHRQNFKLFQNNTSRFLIHISIVLFIFFFIFVSGSGAYNKDTPRLYLGYVFTTHHTPLMAAVDQGEAFKSSGAWLKPMVDRQKYELLDKSGNSLAVINLIVSKSGSETATLFAQGRMDIGLSSSTAFISGIDKGTAMKILCPLHVDGMGMVFPRGSSLSGWKDVHGYIKRSENPVKIGYHSPTSAPRIVFEGALHKAGLRITEDANNRDADILLVDLKSTANLIPALVSNQVECWVGPAPHPSVAEYKDVGHVALDSRDLPPQGEWHDFPCCVMGASEALIHENPGVVQAMTDLMTAAGNWCNQNKAQAAEITGKWIGVPAEAIEKSTIIYTTNPSPNWMRGEAIFMEILNRMKKLNGRFQGKTLKEVENDIYEFRFIRASLKNQGL